MSALTGTPVATWRAYFAIDHGIQRLRANWPTWITREPQEAWEMLATEGLIGDAWLADPRRLFLHDATLVTCQGCGGDGLGSSYDSNWAEPPPDCRYCGGTGRKPQGETRRHWPCSIVDCALFAVDAPRVLAAEGATREMLRSNGHNVTEIMEWHRWATPPARDVLSDPRQPHARDGYWHSYRGVDKVVMGYLRFDAFEEET